MEVVATQGTALIVKLMGELVPKAASNPEHQQALMSAMKSLQKFTGGGAAPGAQQNQLKDLMMRQQQMSQLPPQKPPPAAA